MAKTVALLNLSISVILFLTKHTSLIQIKLVIRLKSAVRCSRQNRNGLQLLCQQLKTLAVLRGGEIVARPHSSLLVFVGVDEGTGLYNTRGHPASQPGFWTIVIMRKLFADYKSLQTYAPIMSLRFHILR